MKKFFRTIKAWFLWLDHRQRDDGFTILRSEEHHTCPYCHEHYTGNYCPQCGMPPQVGDVDKRSALFDFLDIWNLGNTTIFHTMKHLLWRPGYMIADWLDGRRSLYFPPVLTLVTVCFLFSLALSVRGIDLDDNAVHMTIDDKDSIVAKGVPIDSLIRQHVDETVAHHSDSVVITLETDTVGVQGVDEEMTRLMTLKSLMTVNEVLDVYQRWTNEHYAYALMIGNVLLILVMPICFRRSPRRPRTRLVEFFFIQLYVDSALMLLSTVWVLITAQQPGLLNLYPIPNWISIPFLVLTFHQLFGYSIWGTTWRYLLVNLLNIFLLIIVSALFFTGYLAYAFAGTVS